LRDRERGVLGGVAAGFGDYLEVDPVLVRLVFVFLAFMHGLGVLLYLACWVSMPSRQTDAEASVSSSDEVGEGAGEEELAGVPRAGSRERGRLVVGSILIFIGAIGLLEQLDWLDWLDWSRLADLWPLVLIAMGAALIRRAWPSRRGVA
jgi:phage shock protein PspC (stress-responsive transcriptional regulator)